MKINTGEILPVDGVLFKVSSDMSKKMKKNEIII
jgi:hypothetical protein